MGEFPSFHMEICLGTLFGLWDKTKIYITNKYCQMRFTSSQTQVSYILYYSTGSQKSCFNL